MRSVQRGWARLPVAVTTATLAVTLLVTGCGSGGGVYPSVPLVPTAGGGTHVWRWTGTCPLGPAGGEGCRAGGPILGFAQLNGNEWNLGGPAKAGSLDMSVEPSGAVTIEGRFERTAPCTDSDCLAPTALTWVRGYPNVLYGIDQCRAGTSPPPSPRLPLPMRLDSIPPHLIGVTAYSTRTSRVTYDVTYDLWLSPTGTRQPCRSQGTLEILVLTDHSSRALLPPGMQVGTADIPFAVGPVAHSGSQAWSIFASNISRDGQTAPWGGTLWFVLGQADVVRDGRVSVDLTAVLAEATRILHDNYGWAELAHDYWLDTASFGVEFGPAGGRPLGSGPSHFSARISAYCLNVRSSVLDASC